jgi:chromosome segregation ATPase
MTTGEVMRASLVEGTIPVKTPKEETAPTRPTNNEVDTLRKELEEARSAVGTHAAELQSRTNERDQLQIAIDAKTLELQSRSDELHTRTNERDMLQIALDTKAVELQSRFDELQSRTYERDQLQVAFNAKTLELQSRTEERDQLNSKAAAAETRASELETRANELDSKLTKALEASNATRDELERRKTDLLRQHNDIESSPGKRIEEALPVRVVEALDILASLLGRRRP